MKRAVLLLFMAVIILLIIMLATLEPTDAGSRHELHLIVFAQDPGTEIDIKIGDAKRKTEMVDAGVTYLSFAAADPELTVWEYGEETKPRVDKGRDGEWYSIVMVTPPGESVGEK